MTAVRIAKDFRVKLRSTGILGLGKGEWFSSAAEGWTFVESSGYAASGQKSPPLFLPDLLDFQAEALGAQPCQWVWFVELQNDAHVALLRERFPACVEAGFSVVCRIPSDRAELQAFWAIHRDLAAAAPWDCETPWVVAGVDQRFPDPRDRWSERHLLSHHRQVHAIFSQDGWWAHLGAPSSATFGDLVRRTFPGVGV